MTHLPKFKNQALFRHAFIHRSYLNETKEKLESNERLEFLGDSILSFIVSEHLYEKYPEFNEGLLTNLRSLVVNTKSLARVAKTLDFGKFLKLSHGEEESKGRENETLLANSMEAYIGALFIDQGIKSVKAFLKDVLFPQIDVYVENKAFKDPKSLLQEYVQAKKQTSPHYRVLNEEGLPHAKVFTMGVFIDDTVVAEGKGKSKQIAEEDAARQALEKLSK